MRTNSRLDSVSKDDPTYLESLVREDFERCHPGETLEDLKRRASFSKEDRGLLRDWMAVVAARAEAAGAANPFGRDRHPPARCAMLIAPSSGRKRSLRDSAHQDRQPRCRFSSGLGFGGMVPEAGIRRLTKPLVPGIVRFVNITDGNSPGLLFREQLDGVETQPRKAAAGHNDPSQNRQRWLALGACMTAALAASRRAKSEARGQWRRQSRQRPAGHANLPRHQGRTGPGAARATTLSSCCCVRSLIIWAIGKGG
jgi:hypothetical protein